MAKPGLAAVEIGNRIGASAQEVNRLLFTQGFIERVNGAWAVTKKGAEFGVQVPKSSSNLPQAKSWDATYWSERILRVLDTSPQALMEARAALKGERMAQAVARKIAQGSADAAVLGSQIAQHPIQAAEAARWLTNARWLRFGAGGLLAGAVLAGAVAFAPVAKRAWDERG